ncbi:MAG: glycosyltransferase family 4 protein [Actinomycetota bacterium]|nr:glycosyltransferase family 4 protein [Actinomycetota bacterium]
MREGQLLSVLRLCSVFEPPRRLPLDRVAGFDPIGGMQSHTAKLTRALDRLGVRQKVVTSHLPGAPAREQLGDHTEILRLGWPIQGLRQLYSLPAALHLLRVGGSADLVHVHLGEDLAVVPLGLMAASIHHLPMVLTIHCSLGHTFRGRGLRAFALRTLGARLERLGTRRASAVIVLTKRLERALERLVDPVRLHVIPSGVDRELFRGPFADPLPDLPHPRVLFVGRLAPQKGVLRLLRAMPMLLPDAHLVLVGDGPQRSKVEAEIDRMGLRERVHLTGFAHHHHVPAYLAHADVLALPSVYEELGSVLVEAIQSGIPIVASRTGGISEVVEDGREGLLVDAGDRLALAGAVNRLLHDSELTARLSTGAQASAARYDWQELAREVLALYHRVTAPLGPSEARA